MSVQLVEKLRCTHCGAPLPQPKQGESLVKCEYCGFLNKTVDSAMYIDYLKREVSKWISQILPQQLVVSTTADPVARHHVFQGYVKPRLVPVSVNAKTRYVEAVYRPFIALDPVHLVDCGEPRYLFEESVKVEAVSELAVSDEDKLFLGEIQRHLLIAAYICNAIRDAREEKYGESVKNIEESIRFADRPEERVLVARLRAAKSVYASLGELYSRNTPSALSIIDSAEKTLEGLLEQRGDLSVARHQAPLEVERDLVKLVKCLVEIGHLHFENGLDPLTPIPLLKKALAYAVSNAKSYGRPLKDLSQVAELWKSAFRSRFSREGVKVLGEGELLVPFYVVGTSITYASGLVFKKGQGVRVDVLVSATPPVLSGLSDVLGLYSGRVVNLERDQARLSTVSEVLKSARVDYLKKPTLLPLISSVVAEAIADKYLEAARIRYGGKIKLATTRAEELVYVGLSRRDLERSTVESPLPVALLSRDLSGLKDVLV